MTMPEKIYAGDDAYGAFWQNMPRDETQAYIRADIVEELVRSASVVVSSYYSDDGVFLAGMGDLDEALSRINAIMEGK